MIIRSTSIARTATLICMFVPTIAFAELKSEMAAYIVTTDASGAEQYASADQVKPGQTIEYRMRHTNTFDNAIGGVAVTGPVPEGGELVIGRSKSDVVATFEVRGEFNPDNAGEEWSALPAQRVVIQADGSRLVEPAGPEHFTAVRWVLGDTVQKDASVHQSYRVFIK